MKTNDWILESNDFQYRILLDKTIRDITVAQDKQDKYVTVLFTDSSCLEFILNNTADIFYMEEINDD